MDLLHLTSELGSDADLLAKPDYWLSQMIQSIDQTLSLLSDDLNALKKAASCKSKLQQTNNVALRTRIRDDRNIIVSEKLSVMPLPDAIALIKRLFLESPEDAEYLTSQANTWLIDGYDIKSSCSLRTAS
jgi:hypothetical protein